DGLLQDVRASVEFAHVLDRGCERYRAVGVVSPRQAALGDLGSDARGRIEGRHADPARAQTLGERALGGELDLEVAAEKLPGELLVLADVRAGHPGYTLFREQNPKTPVIDSAVVRNDLEVVDTAVEEGADQLHRIAAQPESADREARAVGHVGDRLGGTGDDL